MRRSGRCLAGCLTAALAAASGGPLAAAPPYLSISPFPPAGTPSGGSQPLIVPGPGGGHSPERPFEGFDAKLQRFESTEHDGSIASPARRMAPPAAEFPEPPFPPPTITAKPKYASRPADAALHSAAAVPDTAPQPVTHWVAIFGDVDRPGSYGFSGETISVGELVERCGVDGGTEGALRLVRNGRPFGPIHRPQDLLLPGDMIIAQANSAIPRPHVQLGLIDLIDRPVAVMVPQSLASVDAVLKLAKQTHLSPRDVTVLVGGRQAVPGDQIGELATGSVLVFNPHSVNSAALPELKTNYYPATGDETVPPLPAPAPGVASLEPTLSAIPTAPPALSDINPFESLGPADGPDQLTTPANAAPSLFMPPHGELSALPPVELLEPPADAAPLQFPRTADASGSIPVGPPEADPHIVPIPTDALFDPTQPLSEGSQSPPMAAPSPIELPELPADEAAADEEATLEDLLPTILIGGLLGIATFFGLRRLRGKKLLETAPAAIAPIIERLGSIRFASITGANSDAAESNQIASEVVRPDLVVAAPLAIRSTTSNLAAVAPDQMLAALVADRLALREEPIVLPAVMRIDGRSSALQRRRIDQAETTIASPHRVPAPTTAAVQTRESSRTIDREPSRASGTFRIDPAQSIAAPKPSRTTDTPFEQALAALHAAEHGD